MLIGKLAGMLATFIAARHRTVFGDGDTPIQDAHIPVLIIGSPGIGKTDITRGVKAILEQTMGIAWGFAIGHPSIKDSVDYAGQPAVVEGKAEHLPYGDLRFLIECDTPTVYLLDDVGQSPRGVQAALMQVVRERTINGHPISPYIHFVLCTNKADDKSGVTGILKALGNRCCQVTVDVDPERSADWILENFPQVPELAAFLKYRPGYLSGEFTTREQEAGKIGAGYPSPRSVTMVASFLQDGHPEDVLNHMIAGTVGEAFSTEFSGWRRVWQDSVPYEAVIGDPTGSKLPSTIDGSYAQCSMLCMRAKRRDMAKIAQYMSRLNSEYNAYFWNLVETSREELTETAAYQEWRTSRHY